MTELKFKLDQTTFPMVWVADINAYIHWIPITKIQFEYFLCAEPDNSFDAKWYDEILAINPRVTPKDINPNNYWKAFLTGIRPDEAQRFARWYRDDYYTVPTLDEWFTAYKALKRIPPQPSDIINKMGDLRDRTKKLLENIESASTIILKDAGYERTLADQMLMRMGVIEWVECRGNQRFQWGGMGQTIRSFYGGFSNPDDGQPRQPTNPKVDRLYPYGFRLIRRER